MRCDWRRIISGWIEGNGWRNWPVRSAARRCPIAGTKSNLRHWKMKTKPKLSATLRSATASVLSAQTLVTLPENREKLIRAELLVRCVMLSECPSTKPAAPGHHGG